MTGEFEIEQPPDPGEVAPNRGVHEAREERNAPKLEQARFGIDPRTNGSLEDFHRRADDMKRKDNFRFFKRFEAGRKHPRLNDYSRQYEKVISGKRRMCRIPKMRREKHGKHQRAKQARPALLYTEPHKFVREMRERPAPLGPKAKPSLPLDQAGKRRPLRSGRSVAWFIHISHGSSVCRSRGFLKALGCA